MNHLDMTEDQRNAALESAYTVNWYLRERWGDPASKEQALAENIEIIDALTNGAYSGNLEKVEEPAAAPSLPAGPNFKVAVVIGHNARKKGAYIAGRFNQFEFDFNSAVYEEMARDAWEGLELKRFNRVFSGSYTTEVKRCYQAVNASQPDFVLELHFNGYNGKTGYSFMLHHYQSTVSKRCAKVINDAFVKVTGFDDKGTKALSPGDRGYLSVAEADAPAVLTEPFFGDFRPHIEKVNELGHAGIAALYLAGLRDVAEILA